MLLCAEGALSFALGGAEAKAEAAEAQAAAAEAEAVEAEAAEAEAEAEAVEAEAVEAEAEAEAEAVALLTRVATESPWCEIVEALLGSDYTWQARTTYHRPLTLATHYSHQLLTTHY